MVGSPDGDPAAAEGRGLLLPDREGGEDGGGGFRGHEGQDIRQEVTHKLELVSVSTLAASISASERLLSRMTR